MGIKHAYLTCWGLYKLSHSRPCHSSLKSARIPKMQVAWLHHTIWLVVTCEDNLEGKKACKTRVTTLIRLLFLTKHLYLSGIWFGVAPKTETKKTYVKKKIRLRAQNLTTISDSIANNIEREGEARDLNDHFMRTRTFTLVNEEDTHMSSAVYEESSYTLDLDSLAVSSTNLIACSNLKRSWGKLEQVTI